MDELQQLMEYLLSKLDHEDKEGVQQAYKLYDMTLQEGYSIKDLKQMILRTQEGKTEKNEEIFTLFSNEPIVLPRRDFVLRMLQRLRDEAHRFAITYHKSTHEKTNLTSVLKQIEGIGEKKRKALMSAFGSLENIKRANEDDLAKVDGIGKVRAKKIKEFLSGYEG